jgi:hypothetical protein
MWIDTCWNEWEIGDGNENGRNGKRRPGKNWEREWTIIMGWGGNGNKRMRMGGNGISFPFPYTPLMPTHSCETLHLTCPVGCEHCRPIQVRLIICNSDQLMILRTMQNSIALRQTTETRTRLIVSIVIIVSNENYELFERTPVLKLLPNVHCHFPLITYKTSSIKTVQLTKTTE